METVKTLVKTAEKRDEERLKQYATPHMEKVELMEKLGLTRQTGIVKRKVEEQVLEQNKAEMVVELQDTYKPFNTVWEEFKHEFIPNFFKIALCGVIPYLACITWVVLSFILMLSGATSIGENVKIAPWPFFLGFISFASAIVVGIYHTIRLQRDGLTLNKFDTNEIRQFNKELPMSVIIKYGEAKDKTNNYGEKLFEEFYVVDLKTKVGRLNLPLINDPILIGQTKYRDCFEIARWDDLNDNTSKNVVGK